MLSYLQRNKPGQQSGEANTTLPVDGWVQETLTACQFHTCFISPLPMHQSRGDHRKACDKKTPGLFKVEWCGDGFVGLCRETYFSFGDIDKHSMKCLKKRPNGVDNDER